MSSRLKLEPIYKGKENGICLNVLFDDQYYDNILSMTGVTENKYYCDYCDVGYDHIEDHRVKCPHLCSFCFGDTPCPPMVVAFIVLIVMVILKARFVMKDIYNPAVEKMKRKLFVVEWIDVFTVKMDE